MTAMNLRISLFFMVLLLPLSVKAANWESQPQDYGVGIISCPMDSGYFMERCFVDLSWREQPVNIYKSASFDLVIGTILDPDEVLQGWQPFTFLKAGGEKEQFDIVEVGYEESALVVQAVKSDWYQTKQGWIYGPDIGLGKQTVFLDWETVFARQMAAAPDEHGFVDWLFPMADQPVWEEPGGLSLGVFWNADKREELPDLLVMERQGNWIKVMIDKDHTTCGGADKPSGQTGWIEMTNDKGNPLVYWYTRGC